MDNNQQTLAEIMEKTSAPICTKCGGFSLIIRNRAGDIIATYCKECREAGPAPKPNAVWGKRHNK
jgi:hypothetical protein